MALSLVSLQSEWVFQESCQVGLRVNGYFRSLAKWGYDFGSRSSEIILSRKNSNLARAKEMLFKRRIN